LSCGDIHHIGVSHHQVWPGDIHNGMLRLPDGDKNPVVSRIRLEITESAGMHLNTVDGKSLLEAKAGGWLGVSGKRWLFRFKGRPEMRPRLTKFFRFDSFFLLRIGAHV
jgi:hypothetical protein